MTFLVLKKIMTENQNALCELASFNNLVKKIMSENQNALCELASFNNLVIDSIGCYIFIMSSTSVF